MSHRHFPDPGPAYEEPTKEQAELIRRESVNETARAIIHEETTHFVEALRGLLAEFCPEVLESDCFSRLVLINKDKPILGRRVQTVDKEQVCKYIVETIEEFVNYLDEETL